MNVYFIVNGSSQIGMGHIMRCVTLGMEFRRQGFQVTFISKKEAGIKKLENQGFYVLKIPDHVLKSNGFSYGDLDELTGDMEYLESLLRCTFTDLIVVDSYNVTEQYFLFLKKFTKCLVYFDDLNKWNYPVDVLINGSAAALDMGYVQGDSQKKWFLGLRYNLIREEFRNLPLKKTKRQITDILITTGASDPYHITERLLSMLNNTFCGYDWTYHIIAGPGCECKCGGQNVIIYKNPDSMSDIMSICDVALTAGGTTMYELAACGIPMLVFSYASNQEYQIRALLNDNYIQYIGKYNEIAPEQLKDSLEALVSYESRMRLNKKLKNLVDGNGAKRIVDAIKNMEELK